MKEIEENVPKFEVEGKLKAKEVKTFGLSDEEITRVLEFRRIAEIQREMEGIFLDNVAMTRFGRDAKRIRLFYIDFEKSSVTIREYDQEEYNKYQISRMEEAAEAAKKKPEAEEAEVVEA